MNPDVKKVAKPGLTPLPIPRQNTKAFGAKVKNAVVKTVDWTARALAALFLVATSLHDVAHWLHANRLNHDFSLVGAILVVSVALYLIARKR